MSRLHGFAPIGSEEPKILILGSFPSVASLEKGEYYGHGRNQFWSILGEILGFDAEAPYREREEALARAGIALWDVIGSCEREGSLDDAIRAEKANPLAEFLAARPGIGRIALNGGKAAASFASSFAPELGRSGLAVGERRLWSPSFAPGRGILLARLPSTSPVPARDYRRASDKLPLWSAFIE
jgi:double-stranded uracil-DNA glycosylase